MQTRKFVKKNYFHESEESGAVFYSTGTSTVHTFGERIKKMETFFRRTYLKQYIFLPIFEIG